MILRHRYFSAHRSRSRARPALRHLRANREDSWNGCWPSKCWSLEEVYNASYCGTGRSGTYWQSWSLYSATAMDD